MNTSVAVGPLAPRYRHRSLPWRRHALPLLAVACALAGAPAMVRAAPARALVLCFEDVVQRPWTTPDGGGLNFELLRRVEKQLDERFSYVAKPWRRCLEELRTGAVDAAIGAADGPGRRTLAVYPTLPDGALDPSRAVGADYAHVFLRTAGAGSWDGKLLVAPNNEVAVQSGYIIGAVLRERGYRVRELVKTADDGLRMLAAGLFDVAILQGFEATNLARSDPRFHGVVKQAPQPYAVFMLYLPFNHTVYASNPRRIEGIWRAIATVRQSHEYRQLLHDAGVPD
ncbi:MAG: transporter substrate-binding domain-containing protein [Burkholderiaceae bacterium]|nr:transporter substrate-binding domain-containing protein [Burkholderiaceae bacterium]